MTHALSCALGALLGCVTLARPAWAAGDPPPPAEKPTLDLPEPTGPPIVERLADPPDARVETYLRPTLYRPWLPAGIGVDLRVAPEAEIAFAADAGFVLPFHVWRGDAPGFLPAFGLAYRSTGVLALSAGLGVGVLEGEGSGYRDPPQALFYLPQVHCELAGDDAVAVGFRHDVVFKPDTFYVDLAHVVLPRPEDTRHEIRLLLGLDFMEAFL